MSQVKKDCYALVQEIVVKRDIFCRAPGCYELASAGHHIFGRNNLSTAFNPRYVLGMCVLCHIPWAHKEPKEFQEWVIRHMGEETYYEGLRLSNTVVKHQDFKQIRDQLKQELAKYNDKLKDGCIVKVMNRESCSMKTKLNLKTRGGPEMMPFLPGPDSPSFWGRR